MYLLVLALLVLVAAYAPHWKPVTRVTALKKWLGQATAAVGVITSFTFFTQVGVLEPNRDEVISHLRAIYARTVERQSSAVARRLNAEIVRATVAKLNPLTSAESSVMLKAVDEISLLPPSKEELLRGIAEDPLWAISAPARSEVASPAILRELPERDPLGAIAAQNEISTRRALLADEVERAAKAALSDTVGRASAALAWDFLSALGAPAQLTIKDVAKKLTSQTVTASATDGPYLRASPARYRLVRPWSYLPAPTKERRDKEDPGTRSQGFRCLWSVTSCPSRFPLVSQRLGVTRKP